MYKLTKENMVKIGKGALIAMGGALLTYLAENLGSFDFGAYTPIVVAFLSVLINTGRQFLSE